MSGVFFLIFFSVLVANPKKLLFSRSWSVEQEKETKIKKSGGIPPPPPPPTLLVVCVACCHPMYSGRQVCERPSRGHTGGRSHRISPPFFCEMLALFFLARRIQPLFSLVDRKVEFCVCACVCIY